MSQFHSTVSRRDFMKGLGIAGIGVGAAAAISPKFHDIDELMSTSAKHNLPWYVKEVDNPTVEIDWTILDYSKPFTAYKSPTEISAKISASRAQRRKDGILQNMDRSSQRLLAISDSLRDRDLGSSYDWRGWDVDKSGHSPTAIGVPKFEGTPEENYRTLASASHYFGSPHLGVVQIDANIKKLMGDSIKTYADIDQATSDRTTLPNKCKWLITQMVVQNHQADKFAGGVDESGPNKGYPGTAHHAAGFMAYFDGAILQHRLQTYIKALGYQALSAGPLNVPAGILAGMTEESRATMGISPEYGLGLRKMNTLITDMPLAVTKPIDAGLMRFCQTCKICSEACPSSAQSMETEPFWEPVCGNREGSKKWHINWKNCIDFGAPQDCGLCHTNCPANAINSAAASIHKTVGAVMSTTSVFNGFFASMDRLFGYERPLSEDTWWNRDLTTYKRDVILGVSTQ
ncbi:reductive dehalogenase [Dehalogenimonas formicexedens]|uniref:Reductive dehalogenase n=1 Tax=Dehalogenimonas formicexedens TaxID=1839801 RepID=A0A1P8F607_9CHLR|nr:reductive dehalogenase [Dehalogenimonas formicexedens]APV43865.1 reductive dehalogenase [Dehalogenimonas formicexedens]